MLLRQRLRGADEAGRDRVDANAAARQFGGEATDETHHRGLGGAILGMLVPAVEIAHGGGNCDDRTGGFGLHAGDSGADDAQHALEIDVKGVVPQLVRHLGERDPISNSGIGHHHVERAMPRGDLRHHLVRARSVGHVEMEELGNPTAVADLVDKPSPFVVENIGCHHGVSGARKSHRGGAADADAAACDQDVSHRDPPWYSVSVMQITSISSISLVLRSALLSACRRMRASRRTATSEMRGPRTIAAHVARIRFNAHNEPSAAVAARANFDRLESQVGWAKRSVPTIDSGGHASLCPPYYASMRPERATVGAAFDHRCPTATGAGVAALRPLAWPSPSACPEGRYLRRGSTFSIRRC